MGPPPSSIRTLVERFDPGALHLPGGRARVRLAVGDEQAWDVRIEGGRARLTDRGRGEPDALIRADPATWKRMAADLRGGMDAYGAGRLRVRRNLHVGVGFLAATSGLEGPGRLRFREVRTARGRMAVLEAGEGEPLVLLHGLGGTKQSFLPTVAALAPGRRLVAVDLPGFGDSDKPVARYTPQMFGEWVSALLDELGLDRCHLLGHSLGGRVALEVGFREPDRIAALVLMTPSLAWLRERPWAPFLRLVRPELGLIQPTPRIVADAVVRRMIPGSRGEGAAAAAVDEFMRAYAGARGRAAFYAAARQIYLEEPERFWEQLRTLAPESLFIWGARDGLVPSSFAHHIEDALPQARHVELDSGHVPQLERPRELHGAIEAFLRERPL